MAARQGRTPAKAGASGKKARKPRVVKPAFSSEHPLEYICGISHKLMSDPVIAMDGSSYERRAIEQWFARQTEKGQPTTSPITGDAIDAITIPNRTLKGLIESYCKGKGIPIPT